THMPSAAQQAWKTTGASVGGSVQPIVQAPVGFPSVGLKQGAQSSDETQASWGKYCALDVVFFAMHAGTQRPSAFASERHALKRTLPSVMARNSGTQRV